MKYARAAHYDDPLKSHAVQLMTVVIRGLLSKSDFAGWEVMELFAGGVNESDKFFNVLKFSFTTIYSSDERFPLGVRPHYWYFAWRR